MCSSIDKKPFIQNLFFKEIWKHNTQRYQVPKQTFIFENIKKLFLKIILENYFLRTVSKSVPKQDPVVYM